MVGKMLLPYLGGAASVWTTCVLFFQFMLLLGYVYAHFIARMSNVRKQILTHAAVVLLPAVFLLTGAAQTVIDNFLRIGRLEVVAPNGQLRRAVCAIRKGW